MSFTSLAAKFEAKVETRLKACLTERNKHKTSSSGPAAAKRPSSNPAAVTPDYETKLARSSAEDFSYGVAGGPFAGLYRQLTADLQNTTVWLRPHPVPCFVEDHVSDSGRRIRPAADATAAWEAAGAQQRHERHERKRREHRRREREKAKEEKPWAGERHSRHRHKTGREAPPAPTRAPPLTPEEADEDRDRVPELASREQIGAAVRRTTQFSTKKRRKRAKRQANKNQSARSSRSSASSSSASTTSSSSSPGGKSTDRRTRHNVTPLSATRSKLNECSDSPGKLRDHAKSQKGEKPRENDSSHRPKKNR